MGLPIFLSVVVKRQWYRLKRPVLPYVIQVLVFQPAQSIYSDITIKIQQLRYAAKLPPCTKITFLDFLVLQFAFLTVTRTCNIYSIRPEEVPDASPKDFETGNDCN